MPTPEIKHAATAALVTFLLYSPYMNGARNAPASAPQEIDMSVEIYAFLLRAITTEIRRNTAMKILMTRTSFFSFIFPFVSGRIRSIVTVELDVRTSDESVDIEAERTSTTTSPIIISGRHELRRAGIIASKSSFAPFLSIKIL